MGLVPLGTTPHRASHPLCHMRFQWESSRESATLIRTQPGWPPDLRLATSRTEKYVCFVDKPLRLRYSLKQPEWSRVISDTSPLPNHPVWLWANRLLSLSLCASCLPRWPEEKVAASGCQPWGGSRHDTWHLPALFFPSWCTPRP